MPSTVVYLKDIHGLSAGEIPALQKKYGKNTFETEPSRNFLKIVWDIVKEPMFILLIIACALYFILGEASEGMMMLVAMLLVASISIYQEAKSTKALKALKQYAVTKVKVIRDEKEVVIPSEELVPGDIVRLDEGMNIPADAIVLQENDFTVNESIITGESVAADKLETEGNNILYQGTTINTGKCVARITATGSNTVLGKLGKAVGTYQPPKTPLQLQVNKFVRRLAFFGLTGFLIIFFVNYLHHREWASSLLFALTLAMSAIPEEIPVAFSSFMALGAFKMTRLGIISRQPQIVESLGAVSVICLDKTGTITENSMHVKMMYDYAGNAVIDLDETGHYDKNVLLYAILASEAEPFDPMEKAIWKAFDAYISKERIKQYKMIYEYPLEGRPPMMTHVYQSGDQKIAAAKGAAERIMHVCKLDDNEKNKIDKLIKSFASDGYRVIAVASAIPPHDAMPALQDDFNWRFEGVLALYDPPKENIPEVFRQFYTAGIEVKVITGDYPETAMNIAGKVGIRNPLKSVTGDEVMKMKAEELALAVKKVNVFARMFPDAKVKVIDALKANGEITAMTGDGVNDGPALKSAGIGIAMGQKGTEIARQAADLILTDDNLQSMVTAIKEGRKIFNNLKKAVRYIISIHIPIILTASLPVIFGWTYLNLFSPIHVIFMELIMGPTCSIFFEREPVEDNIMQQPPRGNNTLFTGKELLISVVQGLMIAAGALGSYYYFMNHGASLQQTRTIVFIILILSNVFLTFTNRSFTNTLYYTSRYKNNLAPVILFVSTAFLASLQFVPFVRNLFQLAIISSKQFWFCFITAFVCVVWFEIYKFLLHRNTGRLI